MKKIIYLFLTLTLVITSACDPMEDVYADIDAQPEVINGEVSYTLTDEDYEELELTYGNFSTIADAKIVIPGFLEEKYPVWGEGSLAQVTFKWYNKVNTYSEEVYTLSSQDHNDISGGSYGNFDKSSQIYDYIEASFADAEAGDFISLKYKYYAGSVSTITNGYVFDGENWSKITGFTPDEYNAMGESYPNFSSHDEAALKIPIALLDVYKYDQKEAGDIVSAMYELYKGSGVTKSYTSNFIFDGTSFSKYNNVANETIKFGHDGTVWVPDNTIKYTFITADYDFLGTEFGFPGYYDNFDVRSGKPDELESTRLSHVNKVLLNNFPGMAEGQKFVVSFDVYSGASEVWQLKVILSDGAYILQ